MKNRRRMRILRMTGRQRRAIYYLKEHLGLDEIEFHDLIFAHFQKEHLSELNRDQAGVFIRLMLHYLNLPTSRPVPVALRGWRNGNPK